MRATEAMYYGKHGFRKDDAEKYTHLDTSNPETRKKMAETRRKEKQ